MRIYHNLQRFDKLKKNALTFCTPWAIQALWVFLIDLPILILNTTTTTTVIRIYYYYLPQFAPREGLMVDLIS